MGETRSGAQIVWECLAREGVTTVFGSLAHGFNIRFGGIVPPPQLDVAMVAQKAGGVHGSGRHAAEAHR